MKLNRSSRRCRGRLMAACAVLVVLDMAFLPQATAQRRGGSRPAARSGARPAARGGGSVRGANRGRGSRGPASPAGRGRRTTRRRTVARGKAVHKHHRKHHSAWKDARRDYYRFRTINHLIRVGAYVATRPRTYTTVVVSGSTYYYAGGVYYVSSGSGYVVVSSPPGAVVYAVPTHTTVVYVNETPYYYYGGTYYVVTSEPAPQPTVIVENSATSVKETYPSYAHTGQASGEKNAGAASPELPPMTEDEESYKVVAPPTGATVPYLPDEADSETVNGKKYYVYEGTYYRPFSSEGDTVYMVVEDPRSK